MSNFYLTPSVPRLHSAQLLAPSICLGVQKTGATSVEILGKGGIHGGMSHDSYQEKLDAEGELHCCHWVHHISGKPWMLMVSKEM